MKNNTMTPTTSTPIEYLGKIAIEGFCRNHQMTPTEKQTFEENAESFFNNFGLGKEEALETAWQSIIICR